MAPALARVVLHLDLDAFYASVEQLDHPEWRGRPVVVGADPQGGRGRGVVATASYEARAHGIRSAMPVSQAWRRAPAETVWVWPRFARYGEKSEEVFAVLRATGAVVEPASIDEAYLDLTERVAGFAEARALAAALRRRIRHEAGVTASVGVGPNKLVAKIASDANKPDGLTVVREEDAEAFLAPLPARKIPGVGPKTEAALDAAGLRTCGDVAAAPLALLASIVGSWAPVLRAHARGLDDSPVVADWERKSVGSETTFLADEGDRDAILRTIDELASEAARALAEEGLLARTVTVKIRLADYTTFTRARTLPGPFGDAATAQEAARRLFLENDPGAPLRLVGVRLTGLTEGGQATLARWSADVLGEAAPWSPRWRFD